MPLKDPVPAGGQDRLAACVHAVDRYLGEELEALQRRARKSLILAAHGAPDADAEHRLISTVEEVETLGPVAGAAFRKAVLSRLEAREEGLPDDSPAAEGGGLTLVDAGKVDDWLRMREIVERRGGEAKALEAGLHRRLAAAAGVSSNPDNAPVSVPGMCSLFQAAMRKLPAGHEARSALYDAFEGTVVARLGALVAELHSILDAPEGRPAPAPVAGAVPADSGSARPEADRPDADRAGEPDSAPSAPAPSPGDELGSVQALVEPMRLLGAIAAVERQMREVSTGRGLEALAELEARLTAALTPPDAPLSEREHEAVGAVAALLHQAFAHPGIEPTVRARLWKLAPPLALLLLQDADQLDLVLEATRHDPVTGLLDRTAFRVRLESALTDAAQGKRDFAVCLIEVDGFGDLRGRVGHDVAGRLLRVLANLLRRHAGTSAQLARLRGAEFGVLLPATDPDTGWRFASRYLAAVSKTRFGVAGEEMDLTISIGVVEPDSSLTTAAQIMRAADVANSAAKDDGGGCARVHIPEGDD